MNWNTELFCKAWMDGTLSKYRKEKHGGYYTTAFAGNEFLCYLNQTSDHSGDPCILAMRAPSGIMLIDDHNFHNGTPGRISHNWFSAQTAVYEVDFRALNMETGDLAEIQEIDHREFYAVGGKIKVSLFEINGNIYYTDLTFFSACMNRDEYLARQDFTEFPLLERKAPLGLVPIPCTCRNVDEARLYSVPAEVGDGEFQVINDYFFKHAPEFDPNIPKEIIAAARWKPGSLGWGLPLGVVDRDGDFAWEWERVRREGTSEFMNKVNDKFKSEEDRTNCLRYAEAFGKWKTAHEYITKRITVDRSLSNSNLVFKPDNCVSDDEDDKSTYIKGVVQEQANGEPTGNQLDFGSRWFKVIKKGIKKVINNG